MKSIHDPRYSEFIEHLVAVRLSKNVTQAQLAQTLKRAQSYVAKVENLDRRIDIVETRDWLTALGIVPSIFLMELLWWS